MPSTRIGTAITIPSMTFDDKLNKLCQAHRLTNQREFAELVGTSKSTANRWLSGQSVPDMQEALKLARLFGVPLEYLADDDVSELPPEVSYEQRKTMEYAERLGWDDALQQLAAALAMRGEHIFVDEEGRHCEKPGSSPQLYKSIARYERAHRPESEADPHRAGDPSESLHK